MYSLKICAMITKIALTVQTKLKDRFKLNFNALCFLVGFLTGACQFRKLFSWFETTPSTLSVVPKLFSEAHSALRLKSVQA